MIASREPVATSLAAAVSDQYIVTFGKSGGLGCFTVVEAQELARGDRVVVQTPRGIEIGEILGQATLRQARLIGSQTSGDILRRASAEDESLPARLRALAEELFAATCENAARLGLPLQILDVEVLLDGRHAIVQYLGGADDDVARLGDALADRGDFEIRFENLAAPAQPEHDEHASGGCGKPDCGKVGGGGCSSCGSGGGCSSCGAGKVDMKAYFAHLRGKMEESHRIPLV